MKTQINKICPNCKKKVVALWEQICGIRIVEEIKGKAFYSAKCPDCGHGWRVKK